MRSVVDMGGAEWDLGREKACMKSVGGEGDGAGPVCRGVKVGEDWLGPERDESSERLVG